MYIFYASPYGSTRFAKGSVQICRPQKLESLFEVARQVKVVTAFFKRYSTERFYHGNEPKWHELEVFVELHNTLLKDLGQRQHVLDIGLLESALQRPKFMFFYEKASLFRMAAGLGESIIKNHAFLDGNKRAGHLAISMFLLLNCYDLVANETSAEKILLGVAMGDIDVNMLESWIANNVKACE